MSNSDGFEALNKALTAIENLPKSSVIETEKIGGYTNICGDINTLIEGRLCDDMDTLRKSIVYAPIVWGEGKCAGCITSVIGDKWFGRLSDGFLKFVPFYNEKDPNSVTYIGAEKGDVYFWR